MLIRYLAILSVLTFVLVVPTHSSYAAPVYWGPQDGLWSLPGNWVGGSTPNGGQDPTIDNGYTCTLDNILPTFGTAYLRGGSTLDVLSGAYLRSNTLLWGQGGVGTINQSGGYVGSIGRTIIAKGMGGNVVYNLSGGNLDVQGDLTLCEVQHASNPREEAWCVLNISGGTLGVGGEVRLSRAGSVSNAYAHADINQSGGMFQVAGDFYLSTWYYDHGNYSISGGILDVRGSLGFPMDGGSYYITYPTFEVVGSAANITIGNDFVQGGQATLKVTIKDQSGLSLIDVGGQAKLSGEVDVTLYGYTPEPNETFDILYAAGGITSMGAWLAGEDEDAWTLSLVSGNTLRLTYTSSDLAGRHPEWTGAGYLNGPDIYPAYFADFEWHGGGGRGLEGACELREPGTSVTAYTIDSSQMTDGGGVDGHDSLDRTNNSAWGGSYGCLAWQSKYHNHGVGYWAQSAAELDERPMDHLWSLTICGWFKEEIGKPIGGAARLFSKPSQVELYTPGGPDTGKLTLKIPAGAGTNPSNIFVTSTIDFSNPGNWVFFAVTYDGTQTSNNVKFFQASLTSSVTLVSTGSADAGQITASSLSEVFSIGSMPDATLGVAGYLDKITIYAERESTYPSRSALSRDDLEKVRRWHANLPVHIDTGLGGDADLDGDVEEDDLAIVNANKDGVAGPYYWRDGDFDNDLDVDQVDLDIANANYTGNVTTASVDIDVVTGMDKIFSLADVTAESNPSVEVWAARGEHECFQVALIPKNYYIADVQLNATDFIHAVSGSISAGNVSIRRVDSVRGDMRIDSPFPDPLVDANTSNVEPGKVATFWIDIDVPRDAEAGLYTGNIKVLAPDRNPINIAVTLHVWAFNIPKQQNLETDFWSFRTTLRNCYGTYYQQADNPEFRTWQEMLIDYRVAPGREFSFEAIPTKKLDGSWVFDFTQQDKYADYGIARGMSAFAQNIASTGYDEALGVYRPFDPGEGNRGDTGTEEFWDMLAAYCREASIHYGGSGSRPYSGNAIWFGYDELADGGGQPEKVPEHNLWYDVIKANWPECRVASTGSPGRSVTSGFEDHIDIWIPKTGNWDAFVAPHVDRLRAKGNEFWVYQSGPGGVPQTYIGYWLQSDAVGYRMHPWQIWDHNIEGFLQWGTNIWRDFRDFNMTIQWRDAYDRWPNTYWNDSGWLTSNQYAHGNGTLMYPGTTPYDPVPSMRLALIRESAEDWEMLNILGRQDGGVWTGVIGLAENAGVSQTLIDNAKTAADISSVTSGFSVWTKDPAVLEAQRIEIGNAIEALVNALGFQKYPDLNGDGCADFLDLTEFLGQWLLPPQIVELDADFDFNGTVDIVDFVIFSSVYAGTSCDLIAYFPFDTDLNSTVGGITGSAFGSPAVVTTPAAEVKVGAGALKLDGSTTLEDMDGVIVSAPLDPGTGSWTFTAWVRRDGNNLAVGADPARQHIMNKGFAINFYLQGTQLRTFMAAASPGGSHLQISGLNVTDGQWVHVALVIDRTTNVVTNYVNGVVSGPQLPIDPAKDVTDAKFSLGFQNVNGGIRSVNGSLDDAAVFDTALTQTEIQDIVDNGI